MTDDDEVNEDESEFGAGYATCLRQFLNHEGRLEYFLALPTSLFTGGVDLWANAASDHLYGLTRPPDFPEREWERAEALRDRMLHIGHGFRPDSKSSENEVRMWLATAKELLAMLETPTRTLTEAMAVDRALGLIPERGQWSCPLDVDAIVIVVDDVEIPDPASPDPSR